MFLFWANILAMAIGGSHGDENSFSYAVLTAALGIAGGVGALVGAFKSLGRAGVADFAAKLALIGLFTATWLGLLILMMMM